MTRRSTCKAITYHQDERGVRTSPVVQYLHILLFTHESTSFNHRRGRFCIKEELIHLANIFHLDLTAARKLGQNRRWREQLQCISSDKGGRVRSPQRDKTKTDRSELFSPSVANRSTTPGPSFNPSIFARSCTTLLICSRVCVSVLTIMHLHVTRHCISASEKKISGSRAPVEKISWNTVGRYNVRCTPDKGIAPIRGENNGGCH